MVEIDLTQAAQRALLSCWERGQRAGKYGFSGPEMTCIGEALTLTDQMQLASSRKELAAALREVFAAAAVYVKKHGPAPV